MSQANIRAVITAEDKASGALKGFSRSVEDMGAKALNVAKKASVALGAAATAAIGFSVKSAASFEQTRIGIESMLGSADKARKLLSDISDFAAKTPFEFPELAQATRQLVAFGFSAEDAFDTMKNLGDVSSAVGAPINDLAYLMGTLRTQGRAFTIDIRQFAMRGIPIYESLAKVLKVNVNQIKEMIEEGKVGFPEVQKAFKLMTSEGGLFHKAMEKQSRSLSGLFSTLKDNIGFAARELVGITKEGDIKEGSILAKLKDAADALNKNLPRIIENMKQIVRDILPQLKQWAENIIEVAKQVAEYLSPKLEALWNTLNERLIPALYKFWKEVLEPLIPVIGTALVVALGLAIDAVNLLVTAFSGIVNFLLDHEYVFWLIVGVLGAIRTALFLNGALAAFQNVIAGATSSYTGLKTLVNTPMVMPAIVVAAALVSLNEVKNAVEAIKGAIDAMNAAANAQASMEVSNQAAERRLRELIRTGTPEQQARARRALSATGVTYATGGFTGQGGTNEIAGMVHKGEYVIPKQFVDQNSGLPKMGGNNINLNVNVGMYAGTPMERRKLAETLWSDLQDIANQRNMKLGPA